MNPLLSQVLGYAVVFVLLLVVTNLLTRGFLLKYLSVKGSRGTKVIIRVRAPFEDYFTIGTPAEGMVLYKDRVNDKKRVSVTKEAFVRFLGVWWVEIDEETGAVVQKDFSVVTGHDPVKNEQLIERALTKPQPNAKKDIIIYIGLGLIILGLIILFAQVQGIKELVQTGATVVGGNI